VEEIDMNDTDAQRIHETSLELLADPGVRIEHDEIRQMLLDDGAKPGAEPEAVRLPREQVDELLARCPNEVTLTDRHGAATVLTATSEPMFWASPGMSIWHGGEHRPFNSDDMAHMARLLDQLEHVDAIFGLAMDDVPPPARDVVGLNVMAHNSSKHLRALCFSPGGADVMTEMRPVVGDHPWFSVGFTAHGPLRWTHLALDIFKRTAGHGIPTTVNGEPMAGVSGPVTLAGSAAVGNAEILAGICVNQLLEPGRPCIHNLGLAHVLDMRTSIAVTGAPENALLAKIGAALGRYYNLPSASWVSTEAMCPDSQAALEKMFGFHTHMDAGVSSIWGVSQLESEMTVSPAQAVMDNEMIGYAKRFRCGVPVTDESLALDVTREVGISGSFLASEHTLEHFRTELFEPQVLFRQNRDHWHATGAPRLDAQAEAIANDLMANPVDTGLDDDQLRELRGLADTFARSVTG
jgi:trimethylamine:corrinoid methyltransferase-like protein